MLTCKIFDRYEADEWTTEGSIFSVPENLEKLEKLIQEGKVLVAEHWHYRGSRCQDRIIVEDFDHFIDYLKDNAFAGDAIDIFDITDLWPKKDSPIISGKCPDQSGEVPQRGAY